LNIWHGVIYNLQNWAYYANQKASPDVCISSSRSNAKRLLFLSFHNSGNMPFYFRYFPEICWNIVVLNCLFEARIKISVTYLDYENGRVNRFEVSVKNVACLWRKPNIICEFKIFSSVWYFFVFWFDKKCVEISVEFCAYSDTV